MLRNNGLTLIEQEVFGRYDHYLNTDKMTVKNQQNIKISDYNRSSDKKKVPKGIQALAMEMFVGDEGVIDAVTKLRKVQCDQNNLFKEIEMDLSDYKKESFERVKKLMMNLEKHMFLSNLKMKGALLTARMNPSEKVINFINNEAVKIAVKGVVMDVLNLMNEKYVKNFKVYQEATVMTKNGRNEGKYSMIIENTTDHLFYAIKIRCGKNAKMDYFELSEEGMRYNLISSKKHGANEEEHLEGNREINEDFKRLLLVDNFLDVSRMESLEYMLNYYVCPYDRELLKEKLVMMLEHDQQDKASVRN